MKIKVLYEDNHILVVEKPVGILSQADATKDDDMVNLLKSYLKEKYQKPGNVYLGLVHRLDRMVGGVMVFAKTSKAARRLSLEIQNHELIKEYRAVINGQMGPLKGSLKDYLKKDESKNITVIAPDGKEAILDYETLKTVDNLSLVKINLKTGRSHQIRVQFSSRNHPLVGDSKYGINKAKIPLALFANSLTFTHPVTKEIMKFELPIPQTYPWNIFE